MSIKEIGWTQRPKAKGATVSWTVACLTCTDPNLTGEAVQATEDKGLFALVATADALITTNRLGDARQVAMEHDNGDPDHGIVIRGLADFGFLL